MALGCCFSAAYSLDSRQDIPMTGGSGFFIVVFALIAMVLLLVLAVFGNPLSGRANNKRETRRRAEIIAKGKNVYDRALDEIEKLLMELKDVMRAMPQLEKERAAMKLRQIELTKLMITGARSNFTAKGGSIFFDSQSIPDNHQFDKMIRECQKIFAEINEMPSILEQKFVLAKERTGLLSQAVAAAKKSAASYTIQGYLVDTEALILLENEVVKLNKVLDGKVLHPDKVDWQYFEKLLELTRNTIDAPRKKHEESTRLISNNTTTYVRLSRKQEEMAGKLSKLQLSLPIGAWRDLPLRLNKMEQNFLDYISYSAAAAKENQSYSGTTDFGYSHAKRAEAELNEVERLFEEIEALSSGLIKSER